MDATTEATIAAATAEARKAPNHLLTSKAPMQELEMRPVRAQAELDQALASGTQAHIGAAAFRVELAKRQLAYAKATR